MHKVVIDGISENGASLVHLGNYGAINAEYPTTMGYCLINYLSETRTLQEYQTTDEQVIDSGELLFKAEYLSIMKA